MTTRDIQGHFEETYGVEVSAAFISHVTNKVMDEVKARQEWRENARNARKQKKKKKKKKAATEN